MRQRSIIIIPASIQALVNEAAEETAKGGINTFDGAKLLDKTSLDSKVTPDYYACNWQFEGDERAAFEAACKARGIWAQVKVFDLDDPDPVLGKPNFEQTRASAKVKFMKETI